jgi:hypothetical protein
MPILEQFITEMGQVRERAAEVEVYFNRLNQMIQNNGAFITARNLVNAEGLSSGFERLQAINRLDLSIEHLILRDPYNQLFDEETKANARRKLRDNGNFDF